MEKTIKLLLKFDENSINTPLIYQLSRDYDLIFSILQADIKPGKGGRTILELKGEEENLRRGLEYANSCKVESKILSKAIVWDDLNCVHCGACTAVCQQKALHMDPETATLSFDNEKCVVCEMCVSACPTNSIVTDFA